MNLGKMARFVHNFMQDAGSVRGAIEASRAGRQAGPLPRTMPCTPGNRPPFFALRHAHRPHPSRPARRPGRLQQARLRPHHGQPARRAPLPWYAVAKPLGDATLVASSSTGCSFCPMRTLTATPHLGADCDKAAGRRLRCAVCPREQTTCTEPTFKVQPDPLLADILERHFRPGFYRHYPWWWSLLSRFCGVRPAAAPLFGQKDYQQLMVLRRMVQQFARSSTSVASPRSAPRRPALSSRNGYLSEAERAEAVQLCWPCAPLAHCEAIAAAHALPAQAATLSSARCRR